MEPNGHTPGKEKDADAESDVCVIIRLFYLAYADVTLASASSGDHLKHQPVEHARNSAAKCGILSVPTFR
jgi:hypothetical protein